MNNNKTDLTGQLNRLIERLHQTGGTLFGSHITLINIEKGAQYVNQISSQVFNIDKPDTPTKDRLPSIELSESSEESGLPPELATPEAMVLWQKVQQAGYVDEHFQPLLSRPLAAILADSMAKRLGIKNKWKIFGALWNRNNMRGDYNDALSQRQTLAFQDSLKVLFAD